MINWICYLIFTFREKIPIFLKQQGAGSTIQSNDIEHFFHLFLRNKWEKNPQELNFLRNIARENWIWLDNVWLVNKDQFFYQ
ncbi:hypothetical protein CICLE_v10003392mg, partial [Citrus x clementina]